MAKLTGIVFILCCFVQIYRLRATQNDDREILERLIDVLTDVDQSEADAVSRGLLQTGELEDFQTNADNVEDDGELIRAIEAFFKSDRSSVGKDENRGFKEGTKQENYGRQWFTADAGYKGTNATTKPTVFTTTTVSPTGGQRNNNHAPPGACFWQWFRRISEKKTFT